MFKFVKHIFFLFILLIIIYIGYILYNGYAMYKEAISEISLNSKVEEIKNNPSYTKYDDISKTYLDAIVSVEDQRFFIHSGIDFFAIVRAIFVNIKDQDFNQGGSTITQQLAKLMYFSQEKKISRKIAELFVVSELEKNYSKKEILELYVNTIYFGNGYYGINQACKGYFNKKPSELTDYEATYIAGITNAPSIYSSKQNSDLAKKRQKIVLDAMVKNKIISEERANELILGT